MEKVIAVSLQRQDQAEAVVYASMNELEELVRTAGGEVVEIHTQKKDHPDPATFVGKGKAVELAERAYQLNVRTLVFDDDLKPVQQRNLEEVTGTKVVDRTRLILDIFARRARSREGKLQVELAQLNYMLPRITERFGRFEQQTGGIGTRGPGERKLEVDRRRIRDRMTALQKQIEKVSGERALQRSVRRSVPVPQVSLVGYTNAGKSTLLNALLKHSAGAPKADRHRVYADDKLFATLDPTTRRIRLPSGRTILFTDTVGIHPEASDGTGRLIPRDAGRDRFRGPPRSRARRRLRPTGRRRRKPSSRFSRTCTWTICRVSRHIIKWIAFLRRKSAG